MCEEKVTDCNKLVQERSVTVNDGREETVDGKTTVYFGNTTYKYGNETLSVSDACYQTLPCSHDVAINGINQVWNGVKINAWLTERGFEITDHIKRYTAEWSINRGYFYHKLPPVDENMPKTFKDFLEKNNDESGPELTYAFNSSDWTTRKLLKDIDTKNTMINARSKTECLLKLLTICSDSCRENFEARYRFVIGMSTDDKTTKVMDKIVDELMDQLFTSVKLKFI